MQIEEEKNQEFFQPELNSLDVYVTNQFPFATVRLLSLGGTNPVNAATERVVKRSARWTFVCNLQPRNETAAELSINGKIFPIFHNFPPNVVDVAQAGNCVQTRLLPDEMSVKLGANFTSLLPGTLSP